MMKRLAKVVPMALSILLLSAFAPTQSLRQVQMNLLTRINHGGYTSTSEAQVYYATSGRMVTFVQLPREYVLVNNNKGEVQVYDPQNNTVYQDRNLMYSSETTQLYYFLHNQKADLGLSNLGFQVVGTSFEDGLMVTEWLPPAQAVSQLSKVEMAHQGPNPIYLAYIDAEGEVRKKVYFYDFVKLNGRDFPATITQIDFASPTDSTVSKTSYSGFAVNEAVDDSKLNFEVPATAQLITPPSRDQ